MNGAYGRVESCVQRGRLELLPLQCFVMLIHGECSYEFFITADESGLFGLMCI